MNSHPNFKEKMPIDLTFDGSELKVIVPIVITTIVLYALCLKCPECEILIYLIWYVSTVLFLLNRKHVEITPHMIIIHRTPFDHVVVNKKDIKHMEIKNNASVLRWMTVVFLSFVTLYLAYNSFNNIIYEAHGNTISESIITVLGEFWLIVPLTVLSLETWIKHFYPDRLKVNNGKSDIIFYSRETEKLKRIIEAQESS